MKHPTALRWQNWRGLKLKVWTITTTERGDLSALQHSIIAQNQLEGATPFIAASHLNHIKGYRHEPHVYRNEAPFQLSVEKEYPFLLCNSSSSPTDLTVCTSSYVLSQITVLQRCEVNHKQMWNRSGHRSVLHFLTLTYLHHFYFCMSWMNVNNHNMFTTTIILQM
jgi:hypothetical protein